MRNSTSYQGATANKPTKKYVVLGETRNESDAILSEAYKLLPDAGWVSPTRDDREQVKNILKRVYLEGFRKEFISYNLYDIYRGEVPPELIPYLLNAMNFILDVNRTSTYESASDFRKSIKDIVV